jgi:hypothetical protein
MAKKKKDINSPVANGDDGAGNTVREVQYRLPTSLRNGLSVAERQDAATYLWRKSGGVCSLCGRPLDPAEADADHRVPTNAGGATELSNLYLAHRACNRARGDLRFALAQPIVAFRALSLEQRALTFDTVIDTYLNAEGKQSRQAIAFVIHGDIVKVTIGGRTVSCPVFVDEATKVKYFFLDVPPSVVFNDVQVQPRYISYSHVRALAIDFDARPVHEPSNCRLVPSGEGTARLLQFDGQHKTTAQMLLGRAAIQMKIYIEPDIAMIQSLVLKIQQEIKKQPLTRSDTLAKLGDVMKRRIDDYIALPGQPKTEVGFVASVPQEERKSVKREYQQELLRIVYSDEENALAQLVYPGRAAAPTTDKVVIDKIIKPLLSMDLLEEDMQAGVGRDNERRLVIEVLDVIKDKMLADGWNATANQVGKRRAQNFFYQGAIAWWMEMLLKAIRYVTRRLGEPLFVGELSQRERLQVMAVVKKLCDLDLWSTGDEADLAVMRSNTLKDMKTRFARISWEDLL